MPPRVIAALAECYGEDLTAQFATRIPIEVDAGRVAVGPEARTLESADDDEVLEKYVALVAATAPLAARCSRSPCAPTISSRCRGAVGHDTEHVEARIVELLGCTPREARSLHAEMLRRKLVVPVAGLVTGLAVIGGVGVAAASSGPAAAHEDPAVAHVTVDAAEVAVAATTAPPTTVAAPVVSPVEATPAPKAPAPPAAVIPPADAPAAPEAPATAAPVTTEPAPAEPAAHPAPLPRPVITPDSTPMSIPAHETVTIIQP